MAHTRRQCGRAKSLYIYNKINVTMLTFREGRGLSIRHHRFTRGDLLWLYFPLFLHCICVCGQRVLTLKMAINSSLRACVYAWFTAGARALKSLAASTIIAAYTYKFLNHHRVEVTFVQEPSAYGRSRRERKTIKKKENKRLGRKIYKNEYVQ